MTTREKLQAALASVDVADDALVDASAAVDELYMAASDLRDRVSDMAQQAETVRAQLGAAIEAYEAEKLSPVPCDGDGPPDLPPAANEVRVTPQNFMQSWQAAGTSTRFIMTPGIYTVINLIPKDGQQFVAGGDGVVWDGMGQHPAARGNGHDVVFAGFLVRNYGGQDPAKAPKQSNGRLQLEAGVFRPDSFGYPKRASNWIFLDMRVEDCPWLEAVGPIPDFFQWHRGVIRNVSSCGISGPGRGVRISKSRFEDINTALASGHHHTGPFKLTAGRRNWAVTDPAHVDYLWPPRGDIEIWDVECRNLLRCRGIWFDWDGKGLKLSKVLIDGSDFEGIAVEAWAEAEIADVELKNCCRVKTSDRWLNSPEWRTALMLQNTRDSRVERVKIWNGEHMEAAIGIAHHWRDKAHAHDRVGINAGHTIGQFVGMRNVIDGCLVESSVPKVLHQGIDGSFPPAHQIVRASNVERNTVRF